MIKTGKKLVGLLLSLVMSFAVTMTAFAAEPQVTQDEREYLIVNGTDIVHVGEDYENPDTGEYVHWNADARGVDKSFTFKIRYSVTSSSFTVHSNKVTISADAQVEDLYGNISSGYNGHKYTVSLIGLYYRNLQFEVGGTQSGTISGLNNGGSYKVQVTNNDYLSDTTYLVGSGTVSTS